MTEETDRKSSIVIAEKEIPALHRKIQIGYHWKKPVTRTYSYNFDVQEYYYKPQIDYLYGKEGKKSSILPPGAQTFAERCVHYWPGMDPWYDSKAQVDAVRRAETSLSTLDYDRQAFRSKKMSDHKAQMFSDLESQIKTHGDEYKRHEHDLYRRNETVSDRILDTVGVRKYNTALTTKSETDEDLDMFLKKIRRPINLDVSDSDLRNTRERELRELANKISAVSSSTAMDDFDRVLLSTNERLLLKSLLCQKYLDLATNMSLPERQSSTAVTKAHLGSSAYDHSSTTKENKSYSSRVERKYKSVYSLNRTSCIY